MKKVNLNGKLSLNKETVSRLNQDQMNTVIGGAKGPGLNTGHNFLSLGDFCSKSATGCSAGPKNTRAIFCG
jgi:hypothetical protein